MRVALHDSDNTGFPNLALMKLSTKYKEKGFDVSPFNSLLANTYDFIYSSKVFTWTPEDPYLPVHTIKGGTGYGNGVNLHDSTEHLCPDYSLYSCDKSYGFLTRGCSRHCKHCFVPKKEGGIRAHTDIEEFCRHKEVILMDNNVLACDHGIHQIEKMGSMGLKVDFNQGLDARLIDDSVAKTLGKVKWIRYIRLACDSINMMDAVRRAVEHIRWNNAGRSEIFCYVLVKEVEEALEIVRFLKSMYVFPHAQPYRDPEGNEPTYLQKAFARWCNHRAAYKSCTWEEYKTKKELGNEQG